MNAIRELWLKTLSGGFWEEFRTRYYFKYVLPRVHEVNLDGVRLDVSGLPLKARNRLLNGGYEGPEKRMCLEYLEASDAVVELGSAIGFIGLICQKKIGIRAYYSFEANPWTYRLLRRNYTLNGLEARAWNVALGPVDGEVELDMGADFWENTILERGDGSGAKAVVRAGTLGTLLKQVGEPVNALVIDIEGAEQFIDFARLPSEITKIIIELHRPVLGPELLYAIIGELVGAGYRVAEEEEGIFVFLKGVSRALRQAGPLGSGAGREALTYDGTR